MCLCYVKKSLVYRFYTRKDMGVENEHYLDGCNVMLHILKLLLLCTYLLTAYAYLLFTSFTRPRVAVAHFG
jgi:hypothetical protein